MSSMNRVGTGSIRWLGGLALIGALAMAGCNADEDTFIGEPHEIRATGGLEIAGEVGADLGPFVVLVVDTAGTGVPGVTVTFTISGPATLVTATAQTNQDGSAFTSIHLGHDVGLITITATAAGLNTPAVFHTNSFAGVATSFAIAGGQGQSAARSTQVGDPLAVLFTDQYNNPVRTGVVFWETTGGTIATPVGHPGPDGFTLTNFTMPATPGPVTVTATALVNGTSTVLTFNLTSQ